LCVLCASALRFWSLGRLRSGMNQCTYCVVAHGAITALFALSNRMAHLTNMRANQEFYLLGRVPSVKK
ncbi:MAG: hypothetical protein ACREUQ_08305, partial [Burkholderiales bacterium]